MPTPDTSDVDQLERSKQVIKFDELERLAYDGLQVNLQTVRQQIARLQEQANELERKLWERVATNHGVLWSGATPNVDPQAGEVILEVKA